MPRGKKGTGRPRPKSRVQRWQEACDQARQAVDALREKADELTADGTPSAEKFTEEMQPLADAAENALTELEEIRSEFESWRDSLPENFQSSALGEKLDAMCDLDLDFNLDVTDPEDTSSIDDLDSQVSEAESAELPLGFGRD